MNTHFLMKHSLVFVLVLAVSMTLLPASVQAKPKAPQTRNPADLLVVDCLLPGQLRKLGRRANFMSARRPIRTTQADCEIRGGEYVAYDRANYQTALKVWLESATMGDADAQNYVGEIYLKGLGTQPDYGMAKAWFEKAAAQGLGRAQINLGYLYEKGLGVAKDPAKAINLYREASGIKDKLLYASVVDVQLKAKDVQIQSLEQTVQRTQAENTQLKAQLASKKQQLQRAQRSLSATQSKLNSTQARLGSQAKQLSSARQALSDQQRAFITMKTEHEQAIKRVQSLQSSGGSTLAEAKAKVRALEQALKTKESALKTQRSAFERDLNTLQANAKTQQKEDWALMKTLENTLLNQQAEVDSAKSQLAVMESVIAQQSTGDMYGQPPKVEILQPMLTAMRGQPAALLQGGAGVRDVVGRVTTPGSIQSLRVNDVDVPVDASGKFQTQINVGKDGAMVDVVATSNNSQSSKVSFMMLPQSASKSTAIGQVADMSASATRGVKFGNYYALVIGNNDYSDAGFGRLNSAVADASAVALTLKKQYGYKVTLLTNASKLDVLAALNQMRENLSAKDNLLVYYAGHGALNGSQGYWVPVDGRSNDQSSWVANSAISGILETMQAKHVMVIADSCYSGTLTSAAAPTFDAGNMPADQWKGWVKQMNSSKARVAMTSGGIQPVPDQGAGGKHSTFAKALLDTLRDNTQVLESGQLFRAISSALAVASLDAPINQVPEYAPIQFAGHEAGTFFFKPK